MSGYHLLGTITDRVITIRVKNALALAKAQSSLATVASWVPGAGEDFVVEQTYEAIAGKINESLTAQKADAEVKVVDGVQPWVTYFTAPKAALPTPGTPTRNRRAGRGPASGPPRTTPCT